MKYLLIHLLFVSSVGFAQNQSGRNLEILCQDSIDRSGLKSIVYKNKKYFKNFSVLIRDTCNNANRFTNCYVESKTLCLNEYYYDPYLVDSLTVIEVESYFIEWIKSLSKKERNSFNYFKTGSIKKYIRIYGGCIDENGKKFIIVQFLRKREFFKDPYYFSSFNLLAGRPKKDLRFIFFSKLENELRVDSFFL